MAKDRLRRRADVQVCFATSVNLINWGSVQRSRTLIRKTARAERQRRVSELAPKDGVHFDRRRTLLFAPRTAHPTDANSCAGLDRRLSSGQTDCLDTEQDLLGQLRIVPRREQDVQDSASLRAGGLRDGCVAHDEAEQEVPQERLARPSAVGKGRATTREDGAPAKRVRILYGLVGSGAAALGEEAREKHREERAGAREGQTGRGWDGRGRSISLTE
jgi:hypothetical protein